MLDEHPRNGGDVMTALVQRPPFDAALPETPRPSWLPKDDLPPEGWHLFESGAFPHVTDEALIGEEKTA